MGCVFCKKSEPAPKEDVGLEGDFRGYGASDRYGPDPTLARPASSFAHIPNYNNFSPQSVGPAFLDGGTIRGISGESRGSRQALPGPWENLKGGEIWAFFRSLGYDRDCFLHSLRECVPPYPQKPWSEGETALFPV